MFIVNGQATVGTQKFWRIDDMSEVEREDYDPIEFLRSPFALINTRGRDRDQVQQLINRLNADPVKV